MHDGQAKISFRFVGKAGVADPLTREFTDQNLVIPGGAHVPRIGEIVELTHWDARRDMQVATYVVLSVYTRLALFDGKNKTSAWHTTITVGEPPSDIDTRFLGVT